MRNGLLLLAACAILGASPSRAAEMTALTVTIKTQGGKAIDRASLIVRFVKGRSVVKLGKKQRTTWEMRTNQDGFVRVPSIPEGTITIQVIAKGFQTFGQTFDIEGEEKAIEIKLNPPQAQYSSHQ